MLCQHFRYRHRQRLHRQVHHRCVVGIFDSRAMQLTKVMFFFQYLSLFTRLKKRKGKAEEESSPMPKA